MKHLADVEVQRRTKPIIEEREGTTRGQVDYISLSNIKYASEKHVIRDRIIICSQALSSEERRQREKERRAFTLRRTMSAVPEFKVKTSQSVN